jgi:hypothetical protein
LLLFFETIVIFFKKNRMQGLAGELRETLGRECLEEAYLAAKDGREEAQILKRTLYGCFI